MYIAENVDFNDNIMAFEHLVCNIIYLNKQCYTYGKKLK